MPRAIKLTTTDTARLRALRAQALVTDPWAFGSAPGDDRFESEDAARRALADGSQSIFAIEAAGSNGQQPPLVAMAGIKRADRIKHPHLATVWGVFTSPDHRGRGYARAVMHACIDQARDWPTIERVCLGVSDRTPNARALYESLGFVLWGTEPDCVRIGNESAAEHHMHLQL